MQDFLTSYPIIVSIELYLSYSYAFVRNIFILSSVFYNDDEFINELWTFTKSYRIRNGIGLCRYSDAQRQIIDEITNGGS